MTIEHILTEIFNRPLFVTPDKISVILGVLERKGGNPLNVNLSDLLPAIGSDLNGGAAQAAARPVNESPEKKIAIVSALGSLTYRNGGNQSVGSGLESYRGIQSRIQRCRNDRGIDGMVLDFNSYGGSAQGCERMARFIREVSLEKPIYAIVDMNCFSAAYYLASACSKIILTDADCGVGSIGCIAIHRDQSKRNEMEGDVYTTCSFGAEKADFSPHNPLTDETKAKLQRSVDQFGAKFVATVAEFRGVSEKRIRSTEAGVYYGQGAIDAGLADAIAPFDEAVAMLATEIEENNNKKFYGGTAMSMTTKERMESLLTADDGPEAIAALGYIKKEDAELKQKDAVDAVALEQKHTMDKLQLCSVGGVSIDQALKIVEDKELSLDQAGKSIQAMKANNSQKNVVQSTISPMADGKNSLIAAAEKYAAGQAA